MSHGTDPEVVTRAVVFAATLGALLVGHALGDHVAQTDRQATGKAGPGRAGLAALAAHLAGYHATVAAVLGLSVLVLQLPVSPLGVGAGLAFSVVTHGFLDRRWPVRAILRATGSPRFADEVSPVCGMYAADQALHQGALLVAALMMATL